VSWFDIRTQKHIPRQNQICQVEPIRGREWGGSRAEVGRRNPEAPSLTRPPRGWWWRDLPAERRKPNSAKPAKRTRN